MQLVVYEHKKKPNLPSIELTIHTDSHSTVMLFQSTHIFSEISLTSHRTHFPLAHFPRTHHTHTSRVSTHYSMLCAALRPEHGTEDGAGSPPPLLTRLRRRAVRVSLLRDLTVKACLLRDRRSAPSLPSFHTYIQHSRCIFFVSHPYCVASLVGRLSIKSNGSSLGPNTHTHTQIHKRHTIQTGTLTCHWTGKP